MACTRFAPFALGVSLGIACLCQATMLYAQSSPGDEVAIRAIVARQQEAWNHGDAKDFAADASDNCLFTNIVGTPLIGRKDFEDRHAMIFRTVYAGSHLAIRIRTVQFVTSDVAITESELALRDYKRLPPGVQPNADGALYTELEEVFAKRGSGWQMVAFHNVDRKPMPPAEGVKLPEAR